MRRKTNDRNQKCNRILCRWHKSDRQYEFNYRKRNGIWVYRSQWSRKNNYYRDVFEKLTGLEYLNFIGDVYEVPAKIRLEKVEKLAKEFNLYDHLRNRIQSYSHGMKQKLLIISVLIYDPKNWILDEPMTGLDPKASYTLKKLMKEHSQRGNTVFFPPTF